MAAAQHCRESDPWPEVRVRAAAPADAAGVATLWTEAYVDDPRGGRTEPYGDGELAATMRRGRVWVAEDGEGLLGVIALYPDGFQVATPGEAELSRLAVATRARRHGLGRRLATTCLAVAAATDATALVLWSRPHQIEAHRLYESLGFRRTPDRDGADRDGACLVFVRPLP